MLPCNDFFERDQFYIKLIFKKKENHKTKHSFFPLTVGSIEGENGIVEPPDLKEASLKSSLMGLVAKSDGNGIAALREAILPDELPKQRACVK